MGARVREGFVGEAGTRTWFRVLGEDRPGVPLLMVHGGPGACWPEGLAVVDGLAADRPVVLYDQLGGGRSDDPADPSRWVLDAFVEEVTAVREHLGLDEIHLFGWSWGAAVAVGHLLAGAAGVRSLVLTSPFVNAPLWTAECSALRDALPASTVRAMRRHEDAYRYEPADPGEPRVGRTTEQLLSKGRQMQRVMPVIASRPVHRLAVWASRVPPLRGPSYEVLNLQYIRRHIMRSRKLPLDMASMLAGTNGAMYSTMWGPAEHMGVGTIGDLDLTPRLGEIAVPTLVTSGRHDECTPTLAEDIVSHLPDARWVVFEDSAHCAIVEEPDRYREVVGAFLDEIDAAGVSGG